MHALQPLSALTSLSLTLERGASVSTLSAVGFTNDEAQAESLNMQLNAIKLAASWRAKNEDQQALVRQTTVSQAGSRISVTTTLPNSRAGEMMRRSFGSQPGDPPPQRPEA